MAILEVQNLSIDYLANGKSLRAVDNVSFSVEKGKTLGLVGESGCGKTTTMLALMRLLSADGRIVEGKLMYKDVDLLQLTEEQMRHYRWNNIALVFQGAMNAMNPVRKVGDQIAEAILLHQTTKKKDVKNRVGDLLELVGITPDRAKQYPHQFSGGMRQRAMIAMALACNPDVLIADEPTTALDVMIQAQVLDLLQNLQAQLGLAVILVTHDLGVVAEICDDVLVMYGGQVAEYSDVDTIFNHPLHPYTQRLLHAFPDVDTPTAKLASIAGHPPPLNDLPAGCRFAPRCHRVTDICQIQNPPVEEIQAKHFAACFHAQEEEAQHE